jgi:hypothetical protein
MYLNENQYMQYYNEHYGIEVIDAVTLRRIYYSLRQVDSNYPATGYCYERSRMLRDLLNLGSVATFSAHGYSVRFEMDKLYKETCSIAIPCSPFYRDETEWIYHSVFEYKNFIFTLETACAVPIKEYRKAVDSATIALYAKKYNKEIKPIKSRYLVPMRYEKVLK